MITIEVDLVSNNAEEIKNALSETKQRALEAVGIQAEGYVVLLAPVDTGRLRDSITHRLDGDNTEVIGSNGEYAPYVELGTSKTKEQPFLRPGIEDHISEYKQIIEAYLKGE